MNLERLKATLRRHEATILYAYDDATGRPLKRGDTIKGHVTIGTGRNLETRGIKDHQAETLFSEDVFAAIDELYRVFGFMNQLTDIRQEVLVNMCFNLGLPRLLGFQKMIAALEEADYNKAADEMLDSLWARQVGERAIELAHNMRTGVPRETS